MAHQKNENYGDSTYGDGPKGEYRKETTPVDHFGIANGFGLCDMHGNVWEWCEDHYGEYNQTPTDGNAFMTEKEDANRVQRGGSWTTNLRYRRSAYRISCTPVGRIKINGFRICCSGPRT
ncbi:MAG: formylglycine-generating enzyme family protein [Phormidesmis sp.]